MIEDEGVRDTRAAETLVAVAVWVGSTRLIDNVVVRLGTTGRVGEGESR